MFWVEIKYFITQGTPIINYLKPTPMIVVSCFVYSFLTEKNLEIMVVWPARQPLIIKNNFLLFFGLLNE